MTNTSTVAVRREPRSTDSNLPEEIARAFTDEGHLPMYRFFLDKFGERVVRRAFAETQTVPDHRIKRSRPALFVYLVRKYGGKKQ